MLTPQEQSLTPYGHGCLKAADARDFARADLSVDKMNSVHHHCEGCPACSGLVYVAVQMRTWRAA